GRAKPSIRADPNRSEAVWRALAANRIASPFSSQMERTTGAFRSSVAWSIATILHNRYARCFAGPSGSAKAERGLPPQAREAALGAGDGRRAAPAPGAGVAGGGRVRGARGGGAGGGGGGRAGRRARRGRGGRPPRRRPQEAASRPAPPVPPPENPRSRNE